jgi:hypothetical protein
MSYFCELHYVGAARGAASNVSRLGCRIKNEFRNGAISMKSILQGIAILSAAALIAGCDSNSGGASSVGVTPPTPQTSSTGSAVKGLINGATVTASDTGGTRQIGSSTVLNGTYNIAYDTAFAPFVDQHYVTTKILTTLVTTASSSTAHSSLLVRAMTLQAQFFAAIFLQELRAVYLMPHRCLKSLLARLQVL